MDKEAHARLLAEIVEQKRSGGEMAVPLELFFAGNDDLGSIGCNLGEDQPSIQEFYRRLTLLREQDGVQDVWVRIADSNDGNGWPYTDTVYVISKLPQHMIEAALEKLRFDEITPGWMYGKPASAPEPIMGFTPYSVWWD